MSEERRVEESKIKEVREVELKRIPSGIPELDDALDGGIPQGSWVLIAGPPGTYKTIFSIYYASAGLESGDKVIYVTTEQEFGDVIIQARQLGVDFRKYNVLNLFSVIRYDEESKTYKLTEVERAPDIVVIDLFGLRATSRYVRSVKRREGEEAKVVSPLSVETLINALDITYKDVLDVERRESVRLVVDSLSAFWSHAPALARSVSYRLKQAYHRSNITALLTCQYALTTKGTFGFGAEHIADVVIETRATEVDEVIRGKEYKTYWFISKARMTPIRNRLFEVNVEHDDEADVSKIKLVPVRTR